MKESMKAHGVEKQDETEVEKVSGGYVGKDWNEKYAKEYSELGIRHIRNLFGYDEYYVCGHKVPKEYVYNVVAATRIGDPLRDEKGLASGAGHVRSDFIELKKELEAGRSDKLTKIWENPNYPLDFPVY